MKTEEFLDKLDRVKRVGSGWEARCPAHEDREASLGIAETEDRILVTCRAGCVTPAVMSAMGLGLRDLYFDTQVGGPFVPRENEEAEVVYQYVNAAGQPVVEVHRFPGKKFLQKLAGSDEWGLKGLSNIPLFHLPQLMVGIAAGRMIYVVEGEKDVLAIERAGGVATCSIGGAGKWKSNYSHLLRGAKFVTIVADKDEPGINHAETVSESLADIPHSIVQAAEGKDAHDHLAAGGTLQSGDVKFVPMPKSRKGVTLRRGDMYSPETVEWIPGFEDFIPYSGITSLVGLPGVNKSTLTCRVAAEETRRGHGVLLCSAEDSIPAVIIPRLKAAGADLKRVHFSTNHLTFPKDIEGIAQWIEEENIRLFVIDPLEAHLNPDVDSHKNQSIRGALAPLGMVADVNKCAVIIVGHPNKNRTNDPMMRSGGSIGIPGIARSALIMGNHPDHPLDDGLRVLAWYKGNWAQNPVSKVYRVQGVAVGTMDTSIRLETAGETRIKARQLFKAHQDNDEGGEE